MPHGKDHHRARLAPCLLAALLLHAALLGLPPNRLAREHMPAGKGLQVSLEFPRRLPAPPPDRTTEALPPAPSRPALVDPSEHATGGDGSPVRAPDPALPTVAQLREQAAHLTPRMAPARIPLIGRVTHSERYARLGRPILEPRANLFDGLALPSRSEMVDHWHEPGGSLKLVLRTLTGHTLCGRQEPEDPFRPWLQMPMLWQVCGGDGRHQAR